jgi:hypothetical protein
MHLRLLESGRFVPEPPALVHLAQRLDLPHGRAQSTAARAWLGPAYLERPLTDHSNQYSSVIAAC